MNFYRFSLRYLLRKPVQTLLLVIGIALGVSVVIAIDYSNEAARTAMDLSVQSVLGNATHQITANNGGIDERIIVELITDGKLSQVSPVVEGYVSVPQIEGNNMLLMGIDPFLDYEMRNIYGMDATVIFSLVNSISRKGSILLAEETAEAQHLKPGDTLTVEFQGRSHNLEIVGLISNQDAVIRQTINGLILTDIASAQEILDKIGYLDRAEIILNEDEAAKLIPLLPAGYMLTEREERRAQLENIVSAFQINLTALSLLAFVVGLFLIYNTMTFSVVQRRELIGVYRSFGFYKSEIFKIIIFEALLIAAFGTLLGIAGGILIGSQAVGLILRTINDLYFVTTVQAVAVPAISLIKGVALGVAASVAVALPPAFEATRITPRNAGLRSGLEKKTLQFTNGMILAALALFLIATLLLVLPLFSLNLWWAFLAIFLLVSGFVLLTAAALNWIFPTLADLFRRMLGLFPGMAVRELHRSLSRSGIAISSLMVAVSVTLGMTIMIDSFRLTVVQWLDETLVGDIYFSVPDQFQNQSRAQIDERVLAELLQYPGIERYHTLATVTHSGEFGDIQVNVIDNENVANERVFKQVGIRRVEIWNAMQEDNVLLSEPLAWRLGLDVGDSIFLSSPGGPVPLKIAAVFKDYASSQGHLLAARGMYERYWEAPELTAVTLFMKPGVAMPAAVSDLAAINAGQAQRIVIRDNQTLKHDTMEVFERTFAITSALRSIVTFVAVIGILGAVLLILEERKQEIGILKALGVQPGEFWELLLTETGLMGFFAGIFAIPTGIVISITLIYVINLRSFGWTIQFHFEGAYIVKALALAVISAMAASIFPSIKIKNLQTIEIIRNE